jgi:hypothetical protein
LAYNSWISLVAPSLGAEVADAYKALVDTTSGYLLAAYNSGDNTHPTALGHQVMAVQVAKAMQRASRKDLTPAMSLVQSVTPVGNLISDPLAVGGTTQPAGFFEWPGGTGTAPTYSLVSDTSNVLPAGRWAQMDFDATAAGGVRRLSSGALSPAAWAVGNSLAAVSHVQIEDVSGTWQSDVAAGTAAFSMGTIDQGGGFLSGVGSIVPSAFAGIRQSVNPTFYDIGPIFYPFTIPAGTTALNEWWSLTLPTGKHVKMRIGCMGVLNLNALGITSLGTGNAMVIDLSLS